MRRGRSARRPWPSPTPTGAAGDPMAPDRLWADSAALMRPAGVEPDPWRLLLLRGSWQRASDLTFA
jgi:hypothetical protein